MRGGGQSTRSQGAAASHVGLVRGHNEDRLALDLSLGLALVADGMGGHAAGEVAAEMVAEGLEEALRDAWEAWAEEAAGPPERETLSAWIEAAVSKVNRAVYERARREPETRGMGTTLALVWAVGGYAVIAHVGDSRVYLLRDGQAHQLTDDHSMLAEQVRQGVISAEEASRSPLGNVLSRSVGLTPRVRVDLLVIDLAPADRFLVCSDGLSGTVSPEAWPELLSGDTPAQIVDGLIGHALAGGGRDNISAVVFDPEVEHHLPAVRLPIEAQMEVVRQVPLFRHLSYKEIVQLLAITHVREVDEGGEILREGDAGQDALVLLDGHATVWKRGQQLARVGPGSLLGEMALVDAAPRSATVRAAAPVTLLVLDRERLMILLQALPELAVKVLWGLSQALSLRLRRTSTEAADALADGSGALPFLSPKRG